MPRRLFPISPIQALAAELEVPAADLAAEPPRANIAPAQQIVTLTEAGLGRLQVAQAINVDWSAP